MNKSSVIRTVAATAACATLGFAAFAGVTFDNSGNPIFVGKGDIQNVFGWNNNQMQTCAAYTGNPTANHCLEFAVGKESNMHWRCIRFNNNNTVVQDRSTAISDMKTGSLQGRTNNQLTGFHIWNTEAASVTSTGDALFSCPSSSGWTVVGHCNEIDAQGNQSAAIIEGCTTNAEGQASWGTAGTSSLSVRDVRPGFDNAWKFLALDPQLP